MEFANVLSHYVFGSSASEHRRLMMQANIFRECSHNFLAHCGISEGMKIIDLGCGVGDFTFLLARLVGPRGKVIGLDFDQEAILLARERAEKMGFGNVEFTLADVEDFSPREEVDGLAGRFILRYLENPKVVISRLASRLKKVGVALFQEMDHSSEPCVWPASETFARCGGGIIEVLRRAGVDLRMGTKLRAVLTECGFAEPFVEVYTYAGGQAGSPAYEYLEETFQSLFPKMTELALAGLDESFCSGIAERLTKEIGMQGGLLTLSPVFSACARWK